MKRMVFFAATLLVAAFGRAGAQTELTLVNFPASSNPYGTLLAAPDGAFYGTTSGGGVGYGTVFALQPPSRRHPAWSQRALSNFDGVDGADPMGGVTADAAGNLYGATYGGGGGIGVVYELSPPRGHQYYWRETVLHVFGPSAYGAGPYFAIPTFGSDGALYG